MKKVRYIKVSLLDIDPLYSREDYGDIQQLKDSITKNGVISPLVAFEVKENESIRYVVISGGRRLEACRELVEKDSYEDFNIPVIVDNTLNEYQRLARIIVDNDRKKLTPLEEASVLFRLNHIGWTTEKIVEKCGLDETSVKDYILLFLADEELKEMIRQGTITVSAAIKKLKKGNKKNAD